MDPILKSQIERVVAPYVTKDATKPPFSPAALIAFALPAHTEPLSRREVVHWIFNRFPYYRNLLFEHFWNESHRPGDAHLVRGSIERYLQLYDSPVRAVGADRFTVTPSMGKVMLAGLIGERRVRKPLRFFDLAPELRNRIYEQVFQYPKSGLHVDYHDNPGVLAPGLEESSNLADWPNSLNSLDHAKQLRRCRPYKDILAPLLTCRQFYKEAMPFFYNLNTFYFRNIFDDLCQLNHLAPSRLEHIRSISFRYIPWGRSGMQRMIELMKSMKGLKELQILVVDANEWLGYAHAAKCKCCGDGPVTVERMPGLKELSQLRGLEKLKAEGEGVEVIEPMLKRMLEPKEADRGEQAAESNVVRHGRKRVADEATSPAQIVRRSARLMNEPQLYGWIWREV